MTNGGTSQCSSQRGESRKWAVGMERMRWMQEICRDVADRFETDETQKGSDDRDHGAPQ